MVAAASRSSALSGATFWGILVSMRAPFLRLALAGLLLIAALPLDAQQRIRREIDIGFAGLEAVKPVLDRVLSPAGTFVLLPAKGSVLVIDAPEHVLAAEEALSGGALPDPVVEMNFAFRTGLPVRHSRITVGREVFFPTAWEAPRIPNTVAGPGPFVVTPAHPTGFVKRHIGVTSERITSVNPDGSLSVDVNFENTEFEGFVNYGSAILPAGTIGVVPVNGRVADPAFFQPFVPNNILLPIISTTRISTAVVVRPRVDRGTVHVDMIPRFSVHTEEEGAEQLDFDLKPFQTSVSLTNHGVGRLAGFANAGEDFNRHFLGTKSVTEGETRIEVWASARAASPGETQHQSTKP